MKTLKNLIWMAALTLTAATWSACSNEDVPTAAEQPAQSRTFTVTTTLSPRNGAATRSKMIDVGGATGITAEWEKDDQLFVRYTNTDGDDFVETTATVTAVNPSTKAATITVTLTDPKDGGDIMFGYPLSHFDGSNEFYIDQIGTLDDINANHASIIGYGTLTVSGSDVTLPAVTMDPDICIWKFSFTDGTNDITSDITKLVIDIPDSDPINNQTYTVTPSSQSTIYVALYGNVTAQPISITAETATGVYRKAAASVTLDVGLTYTTTGFALKKAKVGKVFGADGNIYDDAAAANAASTALALITYVGNDAETSTTYNHGLALALTDANGGSKATWCSQDAAHCLGSGSQFGYDVEAKTDMAGIANTDALVGHGSHTHTAATAAREYNGGTHPTGTSAWFLPSAGQWQKMIDAATGYNALRDGFNGVGGTNMLVDGYWSSTEYDYDHPDYAWNCYFGSGGWIRADKILSRYVRSAIAF